MGRIKSFRQLIRETCWRIIWQFSLGLLMAYLIPFSIYTNKRRWETFKQ